MSLVATPTAARIEPGLRTRRRIATALMPHLLTIRHSADPSFAVTWALADAGLDAGFEVAAEPLRGPVLRALARAWHWAAVSTPDTTAPGVLQVGRVDPSTFLVQWHGAEASLVARTGGAALCVVDGERPDVVDVSRTNLIDLLVAALIRPSGGPSDSPSTAFVRSDLPSRQARPYRDAPRGALPARF